MKLKLLPVVYFPQLSRNDISPMKGTPQNKMGSRKWIWFAYFSSWCWRDVFSSLKLLCKASILLITRYYTLHGHCQLDWFKGFSKVVNALCYQINFLKYNDGGCQILIIFMIATINYYLCMYMLYFTNGLVFVCGFFYYKRRKIWILYPDSL